MNSRDIEQIRLALLRYLDATAVASPARGVSTELLTQHLKSDGFAVDRPRTEAELVYLQGKDLVTLHPKTISPENKLWLITASGRDQYAQAGL